MSEEQQQKPKSKAARIAPYRIKPGQVLNPKGKAKGTKNISTYLRELLAQEMITKDFINNKKMTKRNIADLIAVKLVKHALQAVRASDSINAINSIVDRLEGKPVAHQKSEIEMKKIEVEIVTEATRESDDGIPEELDS